MAVILDGYQALNPGSSAGGYTGGTITIPSDATAVYVFYNGGNGLSSTLVTSITLNGIAPGLALQPTQAMYSSGSLGAIVATTILNGVAAWRTSVVGTGSQTLSLTWANAPSDGTTASARGWDIIAIFTKGGDVSADSRLWDAGVSQAADFGLLTTPNTIASVAANSGDLALVHDVAYAVLPSAPSGWTAYGTVPLTITNFPATVSSMTATGAFSVATTGAAYDTITAISIPAASVPTSYFISSDAYF